MQKVMSALQRIATPIVSNSDLGNPVIETGKLGGSVLLTSRHPSGWRGRIGADHYSIGLSTAAA